MRKLFLVTTAFAVSVFFAQYLLPRTCLLPLALVFAILFTAVCFLKGERRLPLLLLLAGLCSGLLWCRGYAALFFAPAEALDGKTAPVTALVLDYPEKAKYGSVVEVRIQQGFSGVRALLYTDDEDIDLKPGDRISYRARFQLADRVGGEAVRYHTAKGVFLLSYLRGALEVAAETGVNLRFLPARLARALKATLETLFPPEEAAFLKALTLGDRSGFSDSFQAALSRSGLSHTVAVSGMHVSILAGVIQRLFGNRRRAALLTVFPVLFFMLMAGCTPSVVRAGIMQLLLLFAPLTGREEDPPTALSFALFVILLQNPFSIGNAGLQLSFGSMAGILLFTGKLYDWLDARIPGGRLQNGRKGKRNFALRFLMAALSSTLGALVFTTPLTVFYFDTVSLIAPISNLLTLWAVSLAFSGGLLAGTIGLIWLPLGRLFALPVIPIGWYLTKIVPLLSRPSFAAVTTHNGMIRLWLVFSYLLLIIWLSSPGGKKRPVLPAAACIIGLCAALLFPAVRVGAAGLTVAVLNVGQGQCVVLQSPKSTVLVDCGGTDAGDVAADYIQSTGRKRVDLLVLTHYHEDHANGLPSLFSRLDISAAAVPDTEEESPRRAQLLELAAKQGTIVYWIEKDSVFSMENYLFTLFAPLGSGGGNEEGLAVLASAGKFDVLITGDMNSFVERMLVKYKTLPDGEVLVAGHHGSRYATSQELLEALKPEVAVISAGYNRFGHPAPDTLERLAGEGIEVFRTDTMGTVVIRAN